MSWPICLLTLKAKVQDSCVFCFFFELCVAGLALYQPLVWSTCMHVVVVQHAEHSIMPREKDPQACMSGWACAGGNGTVWGMGGLLPTLIGPKPGE